MSNRLLIIEVLKEKFDDYQIFLITYDKEWYQILKTKFPSWNPIELYVGQGLDYEVPVLFENKQYLEKSKFYLANHEHKAAAVYLRTAFELITKKFCEEKRLKVTYHSRPEKLPIDEFWNPIKNAKQPDGAPKFVDAALASDVNFYRALIMNPLSHAQLTLTPKQEIQNAIDTIRRLKDVLENQ